MGYHAKVYFVDILVNAFSDQRNALLKKNILELLIVFHVKLCVSKAIIDRCFQSYDRITISLFYRPR